MNVPVREKSNGRAQALVSSSNLIKQKMVYPIDQRQQLGAKKNS